MARANPTDAPASEAGRRSNKGRKRKAEGKDVDAGASKRDRSLKARGMQSQIDGWQRYHRIPSARADQAGRQTVSLSGQIRTDIYAIGKVMLSLMDLQFSERVEAYGYEEVPIPTRVRQCYPPELVDLLERCLEDEPPDRIAASDLLDAITNQVAVGLDGFGSVPLKCQSWDERQPLWVQPDTYEAFAN